MQKKVGRNFSTARELIAVARETDKALKFKARTRKEWMAWRPKLLKVLKASYGRTIPKVPLKPQLIERKDCGKYIRELVVYNTTPHMSVPAYVLTPKGLTGRVPGVLCIHGHGTGAFDLVGLTKGPNAHHDYALDVVNQGMVAIAPDLRGFGYRAVDEDQLRMTLKRLNLPEYGWFMRDKCSTFHLHAELLGFTFTYLQIHDLLCGIDYLQTRKEVDRSRIGCIGLSGGGCMTMHVAAIDERVKAAVISGAFTSYHSYALEIETFCGMQIPVGIMNYADVADITCLIAPRALCVESGKKDFGFLQKVARREWGRVKQCYQAAGVPEKCLLDTFGGEHEWHGAKSIPFLKKWLNV